MRAVAVVPVKRFADAKQRLAEALDPGQRAALAAAMLADVLEAISGAERIERTIVVSDDPEARKIARRAGADLLNDPPQSGHAPAAMAGVASALTAGALCTALLPGDCPLLASAELDGAVAAAGPESVGVVTDRHGTGTNGLILRPPDVIEPAFGPGSCRRHLEIARRRGARGSVLDLPSMALDLDTGEDLEALRGALAGRGALAPATAAVLPTLTAENGGAA
jgi:2-phospho-L-lactate guanylyltransferase